MSALSSDEKLWSGFSYVGAICFGIPALIIFAIKKDQSNHIKFHSLQSAGFGVGTFLINIFISIIAMFDPTGVIIMLGSGLFSLVIFIYWVFLIIQGFTGKDPQIPVLGDFIRANFM